MARRDDARGARRLYRTQVIAGVYRLDEGAWLDGFFHFLHELGVVDWLNTVQGTAVQRVMVPCVQDVLLYGLKTLDGVESMNALPAVLCSDEALMRLVGFNAHQVRQGQGQTARPERLETEGVGITGLPTDAQYGTAEHGRPHHRRDFQPNPINAVVVRTWHHRDYGPGGKPVFRTNAMVDQPLRPFDADDDRRLIEHCCRKERTQQWSVKHPPQKTARAVRVHVLLTLLMFALATAYRLPCEPVEAGAEPLGWQRWRRQLLEQTRDMVIIFAEDCYGIFHLAAYAL